MTDNINEVHKACDISVRQSDISPSYVDLGYGNYVLSNVEKVSIQCNEHEQTAGQSQYCGLCILHLNCSMTCPEFNITNEIDTCSKNQKAETSLLFAINLPLIKHCYDAANMTLNGADQFLAHQIPHLAPLQWSVFSENISRILTSDTENSH